MSQETCPRKQQEEITTAWGFLIGTVVLWGLGIHGRCLLLGQTLGGRQWNYSFCMAIEQPGQGQFLRQSWTLDSPCGHSLEQDSQFAQVGKEANRQSVVAFNWKLNMYCQHPKCLVGIPLQQSNTLLSFPNRIHSINPCVGTQDIAVGATSKPWPLGRAAQATSAPFVGTKCN